MPKLQRSYPNEFAYLREQRTHALHEIQSTLISLGAAIKDGVDPARWANAHPWATAGTAFGLGVTAGYVVVPAMARGNVRPPAANPNVAPVATAADVATEAPASANDAAEASTPVRDKLAAGARSMVLGAAYGLGRLALSQILEGFMAGMHPPGDPADPDQEYAAAHHAESFSWQPETPA